MKPGMTAPLSPDRMEVGCISIFLRPVDLAMTQAVVDPDELRRFAAVLRDFNSEMQARMSALGGQLAALSQSWRDQEQQKFADEFTQHIRGLTRLVEANEQHIGYLLRKAQRIEEYLQQR